MKHTVPQPKLDAESQKLVLEVTKQLITLSVAAIGVITGLMFTTFKGTPFILSAQVSLFSFLLCAVSSVLTQLAVVAQALQSKTLLSLPYPQLLLVAAWIFFIVALVAFVVFTWANIHFV